MAENFDSQSPRNRAEEPAPSYPRNASGLTYGSLADATTPDNGPDLVAVCATNGRRGFAKRADIEPSRPKSPQEAATWQATQAQLGPKSVPVFESDGETVIGDFVMEPPTSN